MAESGNRFQTCRQEDGERLAKKQKKTWRCKWSKTFLLLILLINLPFIFVSVLFSIVVVTNCWPGVAFWSAQYSTTLLCANVNIIPFLYTPNDVPHNPRIIHKWKYRSCTMEGLIHDCLYNFQRYVYSFRYRICDAIPLALLKMSEQILDLFYIFHHFHICQNLLMMWLREQADSMSTCSGIILD